MESCYSFVACGSSHSLILTDDGTSIYAFGGGRYGQLGNKETKDVAGTHTYVNKGFDNDGKDCWGEHEVVHIACGSDHSALITERGNLYTWGRQHKGQLGHLDTWGSQSSVSRNDLRRRSKDSPCLVKQLFKAGLQIKFVACGSDFTMAIDQNGDLSSWGLGSYGNLGHGDTLDRKEPAVVESLRGKCKHVACGSKHALAVTTDGVIFSWGHGNNGRLGLGDGSGELRDRGFLKPQELRAVTGAVKVAAGEAHSACIDDKGACYTWGAGSYGRLGLGTENDENSPMLVEISSYITHVACGAFHTMFLTTDGMLYAAGDSQYGKLGLGTTGNCLNPRKVSALENSRVTGVSCGTFHTIVLAMTKRDGGKVFSFGFAGKGRLGKLAESAFAGTSVQKPCEVLGLHRVGTASGSAVVKSTTNASRASKAVRACSVGAQHTLAVTSEGILHSWGDNEFYQLAVKTDEDTPPSCMTTPAIVTVLQYHVVNQIACGAEFSLALASNGDVWSWGRGREYQLGSGRNRDNVVPEIIAALQGLTVTKIAAGENHAAALLEDGSLYTWGSSNVGKLGHGYGNGVGVLPLRVMGNLKERRCIDMSLGMSHTAVLTSVSELFTFGGGWFGRLGLGNTDNQYVPMVVEGELRGRRVSAVSCGAYHTLAICDGDIYAFGRNEGRLGIANVGHQLFPVRIDSLRTKGVVIEGIAAAEDFSLAFDSHGNVYSWGSGEYGKLGHASTDEVQCDEPQIVSKLSKDQSYTLELDLEKRKKDGISMDIRHVEAFANHAVALSADGRLYTWGCGTSGRLGHTLTMSALTSGSAFPSQNANVAQIVQQLSEEKDTRRSGSGAVTAASSGAVVRSGGRSAGGSGVGGRGGSGALESKGDSGGAGGAGDGAGGSSAAQSADSADSPDADADTGVLGGMDKAIRGSGGLFANGKEGEGGGGSSSSVGGSGGTSLSGPSAVGLSGTAGLQEGGGEAVQGYYDDDWRQQCFLCQAAVKTELSDFDAQIDATRAALQEEHNKTKMGIAKAMPLKKEIAAIGNDIGLVVKSTLHKRLGAPGKIHSKLTDDISLYLPLYARIISLLRAHPCYFVALHSAHFSSRSQLEWKRESNAVREGGTKENTGWAINDRDQFKKLVLCVYGNLSIKRNEHLFLNTLFLIIRKEFLFSSGIPRKNVVFDPLVEEYFKSPHLVVKVKAYLAAEVESLLVYENDRGTSGGLKLVTDPIQVNRDMNPEEGNDVDSTDDNDNTRRTLYSQKQALREAINTRINNLCRISRSWFLQITRIVRSISPSVKMVCRIMRAEVQKKLPRKTRADVNREARRFVADFLINYLFKPAIMYPKEYGLVKADTIITTTQRNNLRKIVQVLHRIVGQRKYNIAKQPWMVPVNAVIDDLENEAALCVESVCDVPDDLLEREMKIDLYQSYLVRDQTVTLVRLNRLIYLRRLLFNSDEAVSDFEILKKAVHELKAKPGVLEATSSTNICDTDDDVCIPLRIDITFDRNGLGHGKGDNDAGAVCAACKVPLPKALLSVNQTPLVFVGMKRPPLPKEFLAVKMVLRDLDDLIDEEALDDKELEAKFMKRLEFVKKRDLSKAGEVKTALDKIKASSSEINGLAELFSTIRERVFDDRETELRLRSDLKKLKALSASTIEFQETLQQQLNGYNQFLHILYDGSGKESNRRMVQPYADRDGRALTPANLVVDSHGTGSGDMQKKILRKMGLAIGTYAKFDFKTLKAKGVVKSLKLRSTVPGIKMTRVRDHAVYHFYTEKRGVFNILLVYDKDVLLDEFTVTVDYLLHLKQSMQEIFDGSNDPKLRTSPFVTEFNISALLDHLNEELVLKSLLCT
eukprot:g1264.t1